LSASLFDPTSSAVQALGDTLDPCWVRAGQPQQQLAALTGSAGRKPASSRVVGLQTPVECLIDPSRGEPPGWRPLGAHQSLAEVPNFDIPLVYLPSLRGEPRAASSVAER
jgi:hypothetical protein